MRDEGKGDEMLILWKDIKFTLLCPAQQEQEGKRKLINKGATFTSFTNLDANKINSVFVCKRGRGEGGKRRKEREGVEGMIGKERKRERAIERQLIPIFCRFTNLCFAN